MTLPYGKFELPTKITVEEKSKTANFARVVLEPFERGYGHTVGNTMRRILLISIEAPAIISLSIEGVPHEFMPVEGVIEDMTTIVLNLKGALLRKLHFADSDRQGGSRILTTQLDITKSDIDAHKGAYPVKLGSLLKDKTFDVINPDLHIMTVTKPFKRQVDLRVAIGRGYVPSERHQIFDRVSNEILLDAAFSPVRLVNYIVENTRVGQDTDFDRLIFEITTDGRISPTEALTFAAQIAVKHFDIFNKIKSYTLTFDEEQGELTSDDDETLDKLSLGIDEIELSVRSTNCLVGANIETIAELVSIPDRKMLEFRNFGKKSLNEIKAKLTEMGLHLGMDLSRFSITPDNVKEKMRQIREQRRTRKELAKAEEEAQ
jgi:DNA-directed RNA polymerase subunit alpha